MNIQGFKGQVKAMDTMQNVCVKNCQRRTPCNNHSGQKPQAYKRETMCTVVVQSLKVLTLAYLCEKCKIWKSLWQEKITPNKSGRHLKVYKSDVCQWLRMLYFSNCTFSFPTYVFIKTETTQRRRMTNSVENKSRNFMKKLPSHCAPSKHCFQIFGKKTSKSNGTIINLKK